VQLASTPEQDELRRTLRDVVARRVSSATIRAAAASERRYDEDLWRLVTGQLGLTALLVPEPCGGAGAGWREAGIALEEAGAALLPVPLQSSMLAAAAVLATGDGKAAADLLPGIAGGSTTAAVALAEAGRWTEPLPRTEAVRTGEGWRLTGCKEHVVDGAAAQLLLVSASTEGGSALFAVEAGASGVVVAGVPGVDPTRAQATVELTQVPARLLGTPGDAAPARLLDLCWVAAAAESVGVARRCLELAVSHLQTREQFGRPLGGFQALRHRAADMLVRVEAATSTAAYAAWAADEAPGELPTVAPLAKAVCADAAFAVAGDALQLHGGIGFTWEHDLHLYFKRAHAGTQLYGDARSLRRLVAGRAGISASAPAAR
jgi:alkylation response protein AidB-like acyl-CoA dehydrogenase